MKGQRETSGASDERLSSGTGDAEMKTLLPSRHTNKCFKNKKTSLRNPFRRTVGCCFSGAPLLHATVEGFSPAHNQREFVSAALEQSASIFREGSASMGTGGNQIIRKAN